MIVIARLVRATQDLRGQMVNAAAPPAFVSAARRSWVARTSRAMTIFNKFKHVVEFSAF